MNNAPAPEVGSSTALRRRPKRNLILAIFLFVCVGAGVFLIFYRAAPEANVTVLKDGFPSPRRSLGLLSRLPASVQQFVYRVKYKLFGSPQLVNVNAFILHFELPAPTICSKLSLGKADLADTNGLQVWILATNHLQQLYLHAASLSEIQRISSPRFATGHGIRASTSVTRMVSVNGRQRPIGLTLEALPHVRKDAIDLTMLVSLTEALTNKVAAPLTATNASVSIQTNCFVALKMRVPDGSGAFILQADANRSGGKGIFLLPAAQRAQK